MPARTVAEFAAARLTVRLACSSCGGVQVLAPDVMDAAFGPDFDLVRDWREVSRQVACPLCGAARPGVVLGEPVEAGRVEEPVRRAGAA